MASIFKRQPQRQPQHQLYLTTNPMHHTAPRPTVVCGRLMYNYPLVSDAPHKHSSPTSSTQFLDALDALIHDVSKK